MKSHRNGTIAIVLCLSTAVIGCSSSNTVKGGGIGAGGGARDPPGTRRYFGSSHFPSSSWGWQSRSGDRLLITSQRYLLRKD